MVVHGAPSYSIRLRKSLILWNSGYGQQGQAAVEPNLPRRPGRPTAGNLFYQGVNHWSAQGAEVETGWPQSRWEGREETMSNWHAEADVIIIGSGLAGLAAAIEARHAGAGVIVFEKMKITGGNTRISDGALAAPGNFLQVRRNIDDSPRRLFDDMRRAGLGLNHPALVWTLAEQAAEVIDWTRQELGVRYLDRLDRFGGHSVARSLTTRGHSGVDIIKAQVAKLRASGVEIRTRSMLRHLLRDGRGAVSGVVVEEGSDSGDPKGGGVKMIYARRAVVLATGGFANDIAFRTLLHPGLDADVQTTNHKGATAEGIMAALRIGAFPVHLSWIQLGPWGCPDEKGYGRGGRFASYAVFPAGILVDPATGGRIVNEWADRRERADAMLKLGHPGLGIVDAAGAEMDARSLAHGLKTGKIHAHPSVDDLAKDYDIPAKALKKTIHDYNQAIGRGAADPFGKPLSYSAAPVASPPFYTIRLVPKVHYTPGGVGINARAQVLDLDGSPIPRLYAAGEICGGVHGASRLGSCALTEGLVFGRIAGREAAGLSLRRMVDSTVTDGGLQREVGF